MTVAIVVVFAVFLGIVLLVQRHFDALRGGPGRWDWVPGALIAAGTLLLALGGRPTARPWELALAAVALVAATAHYVRGRRSRRSGAGD
jgi:drug/metabolite transporter (DMT)-like permease